MIQHLAVIMDGNRRWARAHKMELFLGHSKGGVDAALRTVQFCLEKGIKYLSLYAFSIENLKRPQVEKEFLFNTLLEGIEKKSEEFVKERIQVRFIGDHTLFPSAIRPAIHQLTEITKTFDRLHLDVLFCYGGQQEIIAAAKRLGEKLATQGSFEDENLKAEFEKCLWTYPTPPPDMIIRTAAAHRLSNFLLYQAAYTELYFLDCLWPDITEKNLEQALLFFSNTRRNYGV